MNNYINLTIENIDTQTLCCLIRKNPNNMINVKRKQWLVDRIKQEHIYRKLDCDGTVYIEYAPLEFAWVPIVGDNYLYIYCLWVENKYRGRGYGKELLNYCLQQAKATNKSGVCFLGSVKQKAWLQDQSFAQKFGFKVVDETDYGYCLYALSFDTTLPAFANSAKKGTIDSNDLTVYYSNQCPYALYYIDKMKDCEKSIKIIEVDSLYQAKHLPCVFNNWAVFLDGKFVTVNILTYQYLKEMRGKHE